MNKLTHKYLLIILLALFGVNAKSQVKKNMENEWIVFIKSFDFSESFKSELSTQLEEKLYKINSLDKNTIKTNPIKLVIGMEDLNQSISNDYIFSNASVFIKEMDEMFPVTICWKSKDFSNLKDIQKSDIKGKDVDFEWCQDFPFAELKESLSTEKVYEKINDLNYLIKSKNYPDLVIEFHLKSQLTSKETETIESIFRKNNKVYVSNYSENSIMLDFQIDSLNFKEEDYYKNMEYLKSSINEISELQFSNKIENIEIK